MLGLAPFLTLVKQDGQGSIDLTAIIENPVDNPFNKDLEKAIGEGSVNVVCQFTTKIKEEIDAENQKKQDIENKKKEKQNEYALAQEKFDDEQEKIKQIEEQVKKKEELDAKELADIRRRYEEKRIKEFEERKKLEEDMRKNKQEEGDSSKQMEDEHNMRNKSLLKELDDAAKL